MADHAVSFNCSMAPYEPGDIAGFAAKRAEDLVARGIADFYPPVVLAAEPIVPAAPIIDALTDMDRAGLIGFGKEYLGMTDEPGADVSDDALRDAIRASADPAVLALAPQEPGKPGKGAKKG